MSWFKVWCFTPFLLMLGIGINEFLLRLADHQPSVVSNAGLFCDTYSEIPKLKQKDVILLGASRMQTGFDLSTFRTYYSQRDVLLLAQSGRGTSYPVFRDIVRNTEFSGVLIIDETEKTLTSSERNQQEFIDYCRNSFSINQRINHGIAALLQSRLTFLNPQSSSLRLWGNLLAQQELPEPFYTKTLADRQQLVDYVRADEDALQGLRNQRLKGVQSSARIEALSFNTWQEKVQHWLPLITEIRKRGGTVIFVRLPVGSERWVIEEKFMPPEKYWNPIMDEWQVKSIHFAEHSELKQFELLDTSHLDMTDKAQFTKYFLEQISDRIYQKAQ